MQHIIIDKSVFEELCRTLEQEKTENKKKVKVDSSVYEASIRELGSYIIKHADLMARLISEAGTTKHTFANDITDKQYLSIQIEVINRD